MAPSSVSNDQATLPRERRTFMISGIASAQLPLRWLGLFAQRDLIPDTVQMNRAGSRITACIVQDALDDQQAMILLEKVRMIPETEAAHIDD